MSDELTAKAYAALAQAQMKFPKIEKDANNPHFNKQYASLAGIVAAVRGPLNEAGLAIFHQMVEGGLVTILAHKDGGTISSGVVPVLVGKNDMQGLGSGITYAKRYSLQMVTAAPADEDDDGNAAVASVSKGRAKASTPSTPARRPEVTATGQPAPPKLTPAEAMAQCQTPQQVTTRLNAWLQAKPVGSDVTGWKSTLGLAMKRANEQTTAKAPGWDDKAALEALHATIDKISASLDFADQGDKLFSTKASATEGGL